MKLLWCSSFSRSAGPSRQNWTVRNKMGWIDKLDKAKARPLPLADHIGGFLIFPSPGAAAEGGGWGGGGVADVASLTLVMARRLARSLMKGGTALAFALRFRSLSGQRFLGTRKVTMHHLIKHPRKLDHENVRVLVLEFFHKRTVHHHVAKAVSRGAPKPARAGRFKTGQCADVFYTASVLSDATVP